MGEIAREKGVQGRTKSMVGLTRLREVESKVGEVDGREGTHRV